MSRIIIAGGREIRDYDLIKRAVEESGFQISEVVSGMQKSVDAETGEKFGADWLGIQWANENNIPVKPFPADWKYEGRAAGPIRNRKMAEYADGLIAIWDGKSKGTKNMIEEARKRDLKVYVLNVPKETLK
jgi:hypothetical protein